MPYKTSFYTLCSWLTSSQKHTCSHTHSQDDPHPALPWSTRQQAKDTWSCSEDGHTWISSRCMPHSLLLHSQAWFHTAPLSSHLLRMQTKRKNPTNSWECWVEPHRPNLTHSWSPWSRRLQTSGLLSPWCCTVPYRCKDRAAPLHWVSAHITPPRTQAPGSGSLSVWAIGPCISKTAYGALRWAVMFLSHSEDLPRLGFFLP